MRKGDEIDMNLMDFWSATNKLSRNIHCNDERLTTIMVEMIEFFLLEFSSLNGHIHND